MLDTATLTFLLPNGFVRTITCLEAGNPGQLGKILLEQYEERQQVERLFAHGHIQCLGVSPTFTHTPAWTYLSFDDMLNDCWEEFHYHYFYREGAWWVFETTGNKPLLDVYARWKQFKLI